MPGEIEHCRPYFTGLLGERYGWVPDQIPEELLEAQPWLKEHQRQPVTAASNPVLLRGRLSGKDTKGVELARFVRVPEEEWEWHPRHLNYGRITAWALSPDTTRLAIGYDDGATWMWETATGKLLWAGPEPQRQSIMSIAFSPGGTHLVSGSVRGRLILWDAADGIALASFLAHTQPLDACAFHPDGTTLLTASGDAALKLWDLLSL